MMKLSAKPKPKKGIDMKMKSWTSCRARGGGALVCSFTRNTRQHKHSHLSKTTDQKSYFDIPNAAVLRRGLPVQQLYSALGQLAREFPRNSQTENRVTEVVMRGASTHDSGKSILVLLLLNLQCPISVQITDELHVQGAVKRSLHRENVGTASSPVPPRLLQHTRSRTKSHTTH